MIFGSYTSRYDSWQYIKERQQLPQKDVVQPLLNAGADRVVVRPEHVDTEKEMGEQLERMAEAIFK
mgnify:CR=1 FL=1